MSQEDKEDSDQISAKGSSPLLRSMAHLNILFIIFVFFTMLENSCESNIVEVTVVDGCPKKHIIHLQK
jgi:hypothetical protein